MEEDGGTEGRRDAGRWVGGSPGEEGESSGDKLLVTKSENSLRIPQVLEKDPAEPTQIQSAGGATTRADLYCSEGQVHRRRVVGAVETPSLLCAEGQCVGYLSLNTWYKYVMSDVTL